MSQYSVSQYKVSQYTVSEYSVMGTGVGRLPDATHVITTGGCPPPMQRIGLGYTEGT